MEEVLNHLLAVADNPGKAVREWKKQTNGRVIGSLPIYVPEEIIYASGALPVKLWGGKTKLERANAHLQSFSCSIVRAFMEYSLKGTYNDVVDGYVFPSTCDHIQNTSEIWALNFPGKPKFDLVYPENRESKAASSYLHELFVSFKHWLQEITGSQATEEKLKNSIKTFNYQRKLMNELYKIRHEFPQAITAREMASLVKSSLFIPKNEFNEKLELLLPWLRKREVKNKPRANLILTGIIAEPEQLLDIIEEFGGAIVADDLAQGSRLFRAQVDERLFPIEGLVQRHLSLGPCSTIYDPHKRRSAYLLELAKETNADGIIYINMKFCEKEEFDYPLIKQELEQAGLPILFVEVEQQMVPAGQIKTRLQAFIEMLDRESI